MTIQITIIGLGQMGGSIGLALAAHTERIKRVGHDKDPDAVRAAHKAGAVDTIQFNLPASVEQADVVVLSLPLNEVRATLDLIRESLKEGAVVLDISPARRQAEAWARESLPAGRHYVGLVPAVNPAYLLETGGGLDGAHADLFLGATFLVCHQVRIPENAVRIATDFVTLLGATPVISDAAEADGMLAAVITLPKLLAVSLVDVTMEKPGWKDAMNLPGRSYAMPVAAAFDRDDAGGLCESALANRDNLIRLMDDYIDSLRALQEGLEREDREALGKTLHVASARAWAWLADHHMEKYYSTSAVDSRKEGEVPSFGARLKQSILGGLANPNRDRK